MAQQEASREAEHTETITAEAREALAEQKSQIVRQDGLTMEEQNAKASDMVRQLRENLAKANGVSFRLQNEKLLAERDLLSFKKSFQAQAKETERLRSSSSSWEAKAQALELSIQELKQAQFQSRLEMANSGNLSEAECQEAQILLEEAVASNDSIKGRYDLMVSTHSKLFRTPP